MTQGVDDSTSLLPPAQTWYQIVPGFQMKRRV